MLSTNKQKLLLEYILSSVDVYLIVSPVIDPKFFDVELRSSIELIQSYYDKYNDLPAIDQLNAELDSDDIVFEQQTLSPSKIEYTINEIEQFCKRKAIEHAVLSSPKFIDSGDYQQVERLISEAITLSIHKEVGLDYFDNPLERMARMLTEQQRISTGWPEVDELLGGGLLKQEMVLLSANSGGGKSVVMLNMGLNLLQQGYDVLYISLELSQNVISQRMDAMLSGIPSALWKNNTDKIANMIEQSSKTMGRFIIANLLSDSTAPQIESVLKEYELKYGKMPDALIVDYLDIVGSSQSVKSDNISGKDKIVSEQLRNLAVKYNMFLITASQQNRGAITATELNQSVIAGGLTKINTTDVYISIVLTDELRRDDKICLHFLKTRNSDGVGKNVVLNWNATTLRVSNLDDKSSSIVSILTKSSSQTSHPVEENKSMFETTRKSLASIASSL